MKNTLQFKRGWLDRLVRWLTWWLKEMWRDLKAPRWPEGAIVEVLLVIWTLPLCGAWLVYWVISRPLACAINLRRHRSVAAWLYGKPEPTMPPKREAHRPAGENSMNTNDESNQNNAPTEPSEAGSVQRMVRRLWETFDRRASTWQRDEGEMGDIIATELRTLNNAYLEALGGDEKVS